ncbi:MAG: B12-binding domain-containing radical SAM protein [candidate division KSB1 bacterium]|nr:B12-binding domain-containing radical SAM protein [candidate division KSB1 bacterium]MDZ7356351.1 B12-binding domain-containing radical SAM protein [candidate division KSB1 bacterium]
MDPIKKILLINPPIQDFYQTEIRQQPLGLKYIQAMLDRAGFETHLLDCLASPQKHTIPVPKPLAHLKSYYHPNDLSPFKLFTHYRHFGLNFDQIAQRIRDYQPDLVGISCNFTPYFNTALETARLCKAVFPEVPIVAGGHHVTAAPIEVLKSGYFDFAILGEGEERVLKLIAALISNNPGALKAIDGLAYKDDGKIFVNPIRTYIENLDDLPVLTQNEKMAMLITSRGCPKNCNFCSIAKVMGKRVRFRSVDRVLDEIELGIKNGIRHFDFEDDHLTADRERAKQLFQKVIDRFSGYPLKLSAMNGVLADSLDEDLVRIMKAAGFEWLNIPLVSGSPKVQQEITRHQSYQHFSKVVFWAQHYGLKVVAYLILGLPEDTLDQMLADILFLADLPVVIGPSIFYPPPGALTFENCVRKGYISGVDFLLYRSTALPVETEHFSRTDLVTLFRLIRAVNFLKHWLGSGGSIDHADLAAHGFRYAGGLLIAERKLKPDEIGRLLLDELLSRFRLRGLVLRKGMGRRYEYEWLNYEVNQVLIERFLAGFSKSNIFRKWQELREKGYQM